MLLVEILGPLEVGDDYPAGVDEDVRDDGDAPVVEDPVGLGRQRMVGRFDHYGRPDTRGVAGVDHPLDGGGHQEVALQLEQLLVGNPVGAGQAGDHARPLFILEERIHIDTLLCIDPATDVADGDDFAPHLGGQPGRPRPDLPAPLDRDPTSLQGHLHVSCGLRHDVDHAPAGGRLSSD